jgi:Skp family chaperone for outer membrane proteins
MFRRLTVAAAFLCVGFLCWADDRPSSSSSPGESLKTSPADSAEVLEAQLDTRTAYLKAAQVAQVAAKAKLERASRARKTGAVSVEEYEQVKMEVEAIAAQLDVRKAEVREVEARLKQAKVRPVEAKSPALPFAVFNMAAVMRDYEKARYQVYWLNKMKLDKSVHLVKTREAMVKLDARLKATAEGAAKEQLTNEMLVLQRNYQDEERKINKLLNDEASRIISKLYDEIKEIVDKTAATHSYAVVFAYPDAVTREEVANPHLKELKLKPPAAMPFSVDKRANITPLVIEQLNTVYPPLDENGEKVDVSKLPTLPAVPSK